MNKENLPSGSGTLSPASASDKTTDYNEQNECSVCMGKYEDDFVDDELQAEWIRCTNCRKWMHEDCHSVEQETYVCVLCNSVLK